MVFTQRHVKRTLTTQETSEERRLIPFLQHAANEVFIDLSCLLYRVIFSAVSYAEFYFVNTV